jgi:hypothetical protein
MQLFTNASFAATIVHQGRLIAIARSTATGDPAYLYSLQLDDGTWTSPQALVLPNLDPDPSVAAWLGLPEHRNFAVALNYRYATSDVVPAAPFQAASDEQYVFLFRQSPTNTIYVDRFVFNMNTSTLDATWEVRYQASHQRYHPQDSSDLLYYTDNENRPFFEPTTELLIGHNLTGGAFSVTRVLSATNKEARWQIVSIDSKTGNVVLTSYGSSDAFPFDATDKTISYQDQQGLLETLVVPGFSQSTIQVSGLPGSYAALPPAACLYQTRASVSAANARGTTVVKTEMRLMIALSVASGPAAIFDLAIGLDGNPAQPAATVPLAPLALGTKPSMSTGSRGLTYAAYLMPMAAASGAMALQEFGDGFVYFTFPSANHASIAVAMCYDTLNGWWSAQSVAGSAAIRAPGEWLETGIREALPTPVVATIGPAADPSANPSSNPVFVTFRGMLWNFFQDRWTPVVPWGNSPSTVLAVSSVTPPPEPPFSYTPEGYAIDGDLQLWSFLGGNWTRELDPPYSPKTVLAVSLFGFDSGFAIDGQSRQLLRFRGQAPGWTGVGGTPSAVLAMTGLDFDSGFAIDEDHRLSRYSEDKGMQAVNAPAVVLAVSAIDEEHGFAIDSGHRLWSFSWSLYSDDKWAPVANAPAMVLAVSALDQQSGYAVDAKHQFWRFDGDQWSLVAGAPAGAVSQVAALETGAIATDDQGNVTGTLERAYTVLDADGNVLLVPFSVGALTTEFVGDMAIDSHLIGYIEGAPPVPSVNMTNPSGGYTSMTSVTYLEAQSTQRRWASSRNVGIDASVDAKRGWWVNKLTVNYSWLTQEQVTTSATLQVSSTFQMTGTFDTQLGQFVPENRGLALVNTASAKVFALRLASDESTLVGYRYVANPDASKVQALSFFIDPAYQQCGQLKSYVRGSLADELQSEIMREQRAREAYYLQYDATAFSKLPSLAAVSQTQLMANYSWSAAGFHKEEPTYTGSRNTGTGGNFQFLEMMGYSAESPKDAPVKWSFQAMLGGHLNLNVMKDDTESNTASLTTSFDPSKLDPGLKTGQVASYNWVTFCTDESVSNFDDFYSKVIDKRWLVGGAGDAKLLAPMMKARRPIWRILHCVTEIVPA